MKTIPSFLSIACALSMPLGVIQTAQADAVYTVRQTFTLKDVPEGGKQVRGWFWMPEDRPGQKVLEFTVLEAPDSIRITRDPRYGRSWIYAETVSYTHLRAHETPEHLVCRLL